MDYFIQQIEKKSEQVDILWKAMCKIHYSPVASADELRKLAGEALDKISPDPFKPDEVTEVKESVAA